MTVAVEKSVCGTTPTLRIAHYLPVVVDASGDTLVRIVRESSKIGHSILNDTKCIAYTKQQGYYNLDNIFHICTFEVDAKAEYLPDRKQHRNIN